MKQRPYWLRWWIAIAVGALLALGSVAATIVGLLAYTGELTGPIAALLVIALTVAIVSGRHGIARIRRSGDPDAERTPRPAERSGGVPRIPTGISWVAPPWADYALRQPHPYPGPEGGTMISQDGANRPGAFGPSWQPSGSVAGGASGAGVWLNRLGADLRVVLENEVQTRRLLAREVHRVPEEWLDDVMRVRMSDLENSKPRSGLGRWM